MTDLEAVPAPDGRAGAVEERRVADPGPRDPGAGDGGGRPGRDDRAGGGGSARGAPHDRAPAAGHPGRSPPDRPRAGQPVPGRRRADRVGQWAAEHAAGHRACRSCASWPRSWNRPWCCWSGRARRSSGSPWPRRQKAPTTWPFAPAAGTRWAVARPVSACSRRCPPRPGERPEVTRARAQGFAVSKGEVEPGAHGLAVLIRQGDERPQRLPEPDHLPGRHHGRRRPGDAGRRRPDQRTARADAPAAPPACVGPARPPAPRLPRLR